VDQINDVFMNAATDDSGVQLLLGGVHLQPVPSQSDYTTAIAHNLRAYLLSQFIAKPGVTLLVDNLVVSCDAPNVIDGNGECRRLVLSEGAGTPSQPRRPTNPPTFPISRPFLASTLTMPSTTHWIAMARARTLAASTSLPSSTLPWDVGKRTAQVSQRGKGTARAGNTPAHRVLNIRIMKKRCDS
jgi:hypothetical protein